MISAEINCCVAYLPSIWDWGKAVVISDHVLGAAEQPNRQSSGSYWVWITIQRLGACLYSWGFHIFSVCYASQFRCHSVRKRRVGASCFMLCFSSTDSRDPEAPCMHILSVLQAECKVNHQPCLLGKSQMHPHTTAHQQEECASDLPSSGTGSGCLELDSRRPNTRATSLALTEMLWDLQNQRWSLLSPAVGKMVCQQFMSHLQKAWLAWKGEADGL